MSGMTSGDLAQLDALRKTFGDQVQAVDALRGAADVARWARCDSGRPQARSM